MNSTFEVHALVFHRAQAANLEYEEEEENTGQELDIYDVWDALSDQDRVDNLEYTPVTITVTEIH